MYWIKYTTEKGSIESFCGHYECDSLESAQILASELAGDGEVLEVEAI